MSVIDFSRSFLTFRIDADRKPPATVSHRPPFSLNNARIQLECRLFIMEKETGQSQTFVLGASCKTERVGVERDIWTEPNADFAPVFSDTGFLNLKTYSRAGVDVELYPPGSGTQSDRQTGLQAEVYDSTRIDLLESPGEPLVDAAAIVQATLNNVRLNARTTIQSERYTATLEYPVKTMNANERDMVYQTDTGPVLYPNLEVGPGDLLSNMELAFVAFNCPDWAEFLIRVPTPVSESVCVQHYAKPVRHTTVNEVLQLT